MFRSIRWRLVISFVLVTLLTVSLVGVLTLSLVKRYVEQRVVEDLMANAESVARQAAPLLWPVTQPAALRELAQTSAFLGGVRVRILDDHHRALADSGSPTGVEQLMWLPPPTELDLGALDHLGVLDQLGALDQSWIMMMPSSQPATRRFPSDFSFFEGLSSSGEWIIVNRITGVWGSRFTFERTRETRRFPLFPSGVGDWASHEPPDDDTDLRSTQTTTLHIGDANNPLGYVELSSGPDFGAEALATTRRAFLLAAGGAMTLAIIVGLLVSQGLTAPLRALTTTAGRMSHDLSARAPVRGEDEIGQLAGQLNQMAERLQASFAALTADRDALRRFIADASHELRTPITALKNFNELLHNGAVEDPATRDEFLAESAVQVERLEWITRHLLDLSRLDAGLAALDLEGHDVGELLQAACAPFKPLAQDKEIALSVSPPTSSTELYCDRARIELALSNLVDNALKFTPHGGRVGVGVQTSEERIQMWVQDDGPGIDPADQPHIFERFYRGRANRAQGSGLGLAIVQSVVQAHGGRVWVESEPEAGSRFIIELPRDKE